MTDIQTSYTDKINYKFNFVDYGTSADTKNYIEKLYSIQIYRIFQKLIECIQQISNTEVKNNTEKLRASLRYKLNILLDIFQLNNIPSFNAIMVEDGSVIIFI